jgi:hypothetical protein
LRPFRRPAITVNSKFLGNSVAPKIGFQIDSQPI